MGRRRSTLLLVPLVASLLFSPFTLVQSFSVAPTDPWFATSSEAKAKGERGAAVSGVATENSDDRSVEVKGTIDEGKTPPYRHDVALQFSPLVGGPAFLPLHVSVLMTATTTTPGTIVPTSSVPTPTLSSIVNGDAAAGLGNEQSPSSSRPSEPPTDLVRSRQHRFDFLPMNAQDPNVLRRLLMLREVPGLVRCRNETLVASGGQESSPLSSSRTCDDDAIGSGGTDVDGEEGTTREIGTKKGAGSAAATFSIPMGTTEVPVKSAEEFCTSYRRNGRSSLHLLSNNCLTFAVRLLAYLEPRLF